MVFRGVLVAVAHARAEHAETHSTADGRELELRFGKRSGDGEMIAVQDLRVHALPLLSLR